MGKSGHTKRISLSCTDFADEEDYVFSDPDEIARPELLINFELKNKYGIFMMDCFNYKFNLFNPMSLPGREQE